MLGLVIDQSSLRAASRTRAALGQSARAQRERLGRLLVELLQDAIRWSLECLQLLLVDQVELEREEHHVCAGSERRQGTLEYEVRGRTGVKAQ